jgi:hypothetical protein
MLWLQIGFNSATRTRRCGRDAQAIGKQAELLLDPVLHIATHTVQLLIEGRSGPALRLERGHEIAWISLPAIYAALAMTRRDRLQLFRAR